jgi:hypothetical protein
MLQNSMVAGIDLTSPRRLAGLISLVGKLLKMLEIAYLSFKKSKIF